MPEHQPAGQPGVAVDSRGGAVIDPTKNVEDLVAAGRVEAEKLRAADQRFLDAQLEALEKFQTYAREAESKFQTYARESEANLQTSMRDAETRRIDQLADITRGFLTTIREMLAESVKSTSSLVSTQLVQIQATFDTRVTKLEAAQLTQAGRSSVADPATAEALARMAQGIATLTGTLADIQVGAGSSRGKDTGREAANARMFAVVMGVTAIAGPIIAVLALRGH